MAETDYTTLTTVVTEGGLLPLDLLQRIGAGSGDLPGLDPKDYHLDGLKLNEAISRSWNSLAAHWKNFSSAREKIPEKDTGASLTREKWLLPLFQELGYGRLSAARSVEIDGRSFPISHRWNDVPIHLVGFRIDLDRRTPGAAGAARMNPHGLVQDYLNRSATALWGFVSNGLRLRILRDSASLTRQAYVEFDLEALMEGEAYSDFALLWLLCHESRIEAEKPHECWLERWSHLASEQGARALDVLRDGVEEAITIMGSGFLSHPANDRLRASLRSGRLTGQDLYQELLRLVYRFIFLFVSEDRGLLLDPGACDESKRRYLQWFSTRRLRKLAEHRRGTSHPDLYASFRLVMEKLDSGYAQLALPALGSFLWSPTALENLSPCEMSNRDLLSAIRSLSSLEEDSITRPIDYRNLGPEELGSIYEALLELHPKMEIDTGEFSLSTVAGHERKTSGSYYTPTSLVDQLLKSALDPVLEEAARSNDPERAILALKVCDPAVGSGHFLIAAAHRISRRLAFVRTGDDEPSPEAIRSALRDVVSHCLYGVDVNNMSAELCRVSLWLEALEPGKPLSFLDHHIRVGNSLIGATPKLIAGGIPDDAFQAIEGDEKKACSILKKRNKAERAGWGPMFAQEDAEIQARLAKAAAALDELPDNRPADVRVKETTFRQHEQTEEYRHGKLLADVWCAAFVIRKYFREPGIEKSAVGLTQRHLRDIAIHSPSADEQPLIDEAQRLARQYQFFHWHLAFPEVFARGGFDVILGNPPWEKINLKLEEYFADSRPDIATAGTKAKRNELLGQLAEGDHAEFADYLASARFHDGLSHYFRDSGAFPATGISRINLYSIFAERGGQILAPRGRLGMIFPTGIVTDQNNKDLFFELAASRRLVGVFDFENRNLYFPDVDSRFRFCLLIHAGSPTLVPPRFGFLLRAASDVADTDQTFELTAEDLRLLSPESGTAPSFRNAQEAAVARAIYRAHRTFAEWGPRSGVPQTPFNMANDSHLFRPMDDTFSEALMPLLEGKHIGAFNWRAARGDRSDPENTSTSDPRVLMNPDWYGVTRHAVEASVVAERYPAPFRVVYRKITNSTNERTAIACLAPPVAVGDTLTQLRDVSSEWCLYITACMNSFAFDFIARMRMSGTSLTHWIIRQIPIPEPHDDGRLLSRSFINLRSAELSITDIWLARSLGPSVCSGQPFRWDAERRFLLRCELDAAFFHLYLGQENEWALQPDSLTRAFHTPRHAMDYVLNTFPIVRRHDEKKYADYRTKLQILDIYERMQGTIEMGVPYRTLLDPPPADARMAHSPARLGAVPVRAGTPSPAPEPFDRIHPSFEDRYKDCVPLLSLRAAAGGFSEDQAPEFEDWVRMKTSHPLRKGMFVAQVVGKSMEPMIHDGSYCLFRWPVLGTRQDRIVLAQHHDIHDPETGGTYTIKRYRSEKAKASDGTWRHTKIVLEPESPAFHPIVLTPDDEGDVKVIAEFIEMLRPPRQ